MGNNAELQFGFWSLETRERVYLFLFTDMYDGSLDIESTFVSLCKASLSVWQKSGQRSVIVFIESLKF